MKHNPIAQWVILATLVVIGFAAFIVIIGEIESVSMTYVIISKSIAIIVLGLCCKVGAILDKKGWIPQMEMN